MPVQLAWTIAALLAAGLISTPAASESAENWDLVSIPGATFTIGDASGDANEKPRDVTVKAFRIMRHEVSNRQFARFVEKSGHVTDAENGRRAFVWTDKWRRIPKVFWRSPHEPGADIDGLDDHPVIQVSQNDARAFCAHYGMRLPDENEWELAARGTDGRKFPWGNAAPEAPDGKRLANFGTVKCCAADARDGYRLTSPVQSFPQGASPYGVLNMAGNVWEWTTTPFPGRPDWRVIRGGGWGNNPYCLRTSYRHGNPPDISLNMVGFRCAADAQ